MNLRTALVCTAGCLLSALLNAAPLSATPISGTFTSDDQSFQTTWTVSQSSNLSASTTSYATGGFVPVLSLFDASNGALLAVDGGDASCTSGRMMDSTTGLCNDASLSASVSKGSYLLVLTEFDNFPNGPSMSDGFSETGMGNFTSSVCTGSSRPFQETDLAPCVQRTGNYSLSLASTATPEPATGWLAIPVLAFAAYRFTQSRKRAKVQ